VNTRILPILLVAASITLPGCATITRGTTEVLVVNSDPGGAEVEISDGHRCRTPCSVELKRKHDYHVTIEKPGYERVDTDVRATIVGAGAAGMAGNVMLGGLIGAGVDAATGATKGLKPNPLDVRLSPKSASAAPAYEGSSSRGGVQAPTVTSVSLENVPVEKSCDFPARVERALCRGTISLSMPRDAAMRALGPPDARSEDNSSLRYGDYHLVFDAGGNLTKVVPPPIE
jgi:hypothetical protein